MITRGTNEPAGAPSSPSSRADTAPSNSELPAAVAAAAQLDVVDVTGSEETWTRAPARRTSEPAALRASKWAPAKAGSAEAADDPRKGKKKLVKRPIPLSSAGLPKKSLSDSDIDPDSDSELKDKAPAPPSKSDGGFDLRSFMASFTPGVGTEERASPEARAIQSVHPFNKAHETSVLTSAEIDVVTAQPASPLDTACALQRPVASPDWKQHSSFHNDEHSTLESAKSRDILPQRSRQLHPVVSVKEATAMHTNATTRRDLLRRTRRATLAYALARVGIMLPPDNHPVSRPGTAGPEFLLDTPLPKALSEFARKSGASLPTFVEWVRGQTPIDYRPNKNLVPVVLNEVFKGYEHLEELQKIVHSGVEVRLSKEPPRQMQRPPNHGSARDRLNVLRKNIRKEQDAGRCLVLDRDLLKQWPEIIISPFGVVDKSGKDVNFPGGFFNYHWVDDHINVVADVGSACDDANRSLRYAMVAVLGADAINTKKFTEWNTRQRVLGLVFDSVAETVFMPTEKIIKAQGIVATAFYSPSLSRKAYRSLMGSLRHVATCIRAARPFLQRLRQRESHLHRFQRVPITSDMQQELLWWWRVLHTPCLNGVPLEFFINLPVPDITVEMNASDFGLCALDISSQEDLTYQFTDEERGLVTAFNAGAPNGFDINFRELLSCAFAVHVWGHQWASRVPSGGRPCHIQIGIDNTSAIAWQNKLASRNP
ncbi:unnamed protein product [Phytophthora fragariaefolia]|uniref:Unnamed protein product n=1 Tax=Phytophthora fragariaefolia TaxID=1490495 RepID=A0A9W6YQC9_9STRA|nr:unnamed protein product [Phytophthora fragariaefolia]